MRRLNDWLASYIEYTRDTEPPLSYHTWTAISIIASTLQRRCFIQWGHNPIFPNNYIVLIGPSGLTRKGEALSLGRPFLEHVGVTIASNRITNEQLCKYIGDNTTSYKGVDGKVELQSATTIYSSELHVFLGRANIDLLAALTDWYDCLPRWEYSTKHHGKDELTGLCVNLLGATAPDWLPSMLPHEAVGGGWTSRTIFVVEDYKGKVIVDPNEEKYAPNAKLKKALEEDLERIKILSGKFELSPDALEAYKSWYLGQENWMKKGRFPIPDPKFSGYCSRRATHIKKIAMCMSASRGDDLIIRIEDFNRAKALMEAAEKKMPRAFRGLGRARFADLTEATLSFIASRGECLRSDLLKKFYRDIDAWTLDQIERVLVQMKVIDVITMTNEGDAKYVFKGKVTSEEEYPSPQTTSSAPSHTPSTPSAEIQEPEHSTEEASSSSDEPTPESQDHRSRA